MTNIRLNKYLSSVGVCSRRAADKAIAGGAIKVNGITVKELGTKIDPQKDQITLNGKKIKANPFVYYAIYKPVGYASTTKDKFARQKVTDLVPKIPKVYPVGRLDIKSEGLMILTNDGDLANTLTHPRYQHEKEYFVIAKYRGDEERIPEKISRLESGIDLDDGLTMPTNVNLRKILKQEKRIIFYITLKEGRKRQIRRMCRAVGWQVVMLKRVRIVNLKLSEDLKPGQHFTIKKEDIV